MSFRRCASFRLLDPTGITEGLAVAGTVTAIASTAAGVAAAQQQARNQQQAANYNATVAANDAQVEAWQRQRQEQEFAAQALITKQEGAQAASRMELQGNSIVARNIAAAASSGLQITGSTQDAISGSAANNELAVLNVQHRTAVEAYSNEIGASTASYNSHIAELRDMGAESLYSSEAANASETGLFDSIGAGLSGAARIGSAGVAAYDSFQNNSPPSGLNSQSQSQNLILE